MLKLSHSFLYIKCLFLLIACLTLTLVFGASQTTSSTQTVNKTGSIHVIMVGIKNNTGMMRIGLFNSAPAYSDMKQPAAPLAYRKGSAPIIKQQSQFTFTQVPYGVYAIKLFQDEFMTGRLKRNFIGKPLEGVGLSNNPKIRTRLPSWEQAKFILDKPSVTLVIQMQNF